MKVKKTVYYHTYFEDFTGEERPVTLCALSIIDNLATHGLDEEYVIAAKVCSIGVAIGHISDKKTWSRELGEKIAYNKALNWYSNGNFITASKEGLISSEMVDALLAREAEYIQLNPGAYIKGYNEYKDKWLNKSKGTNNLKENLSSLDLSKLSDKDIKYLNNLCETQKIG